jgi:NADH-quinone oxidoreductase subunit M
MVYERVHTRRLDRLQALGLHRHLPFPALVFVLAALASMGMPGFSGFPAELSILIGTWRTAPLWALGAAGGVVVAAAFTLRVLQVSFFGPAEHAAAAELPLPLDPAPITWPERTGAALLLAATVYAGLKPDLLLNWILPALQSPALEPILKGHTP